MASATRWLVAGYGRWEMPRVLVNGDPILKFLTVVTRQACKAPESTARMTRACLRVFPATTLSNGVGAGSKTVPSAVRDAYPSGLTLVGAAAIEKKSRSARQALEGGLEREGYICEQVFPRDYRFRRCGLVKVPSQSFFDCEAPLYIL